MGFVTLQEALNGKTIVFFDLTNQNWHLWGRQLINWELTGFMWISHIKLEIPTWKSNPGCNLDEDSKPSAICSGSETAWNENRRKSIVGDWRSRIYKTRGGSSPKNHHLILKGHPPRVINPGLTLGFILFQGLQFCIGIILRSATKYVASRPPKTAAKSRICNKNQWTFLIWTKATVCWGTKIQKIRPLHC